MNKNLTEEEIKTVEKWLREGYTVASVANAMLVSQPAISYHAKRLGITFTKGRPRSKQNGKIQETHSLSQVQQQ